MSSFVRRWLSFVCALAGLLLVLGFAGTAHAYPNERNVDNVTPTQAFYITSLQMGYPAVGGDCTGCHGATVHSSSPLLTLKSGGSTITTNSAYSMQVGQTAKFKLTFTNSPASPFTGAGGFLVFNTDGGSNNANGTLGSVTSDGTESGPAITSSHACPTDGDTNETNKNGVAYTTQCGGPTFVRNGNAEVTHSQPATGGTSKFEFTFTPSCATGTFHFELWYNSENGDSACGAPDAPAKIDFTIAVSSCDDGNACDGTETCTSSTASNGAVTGTCHAGTSVVCGTPDQCHSAGTCNPATGVCSNPMKANGTGCTDNNACTVNDTCQAGVCQSGTTTTCSPLDQCHSAGVCNTSTGACSNPNKTDGTGCSDGNACTQTDTCVSGSCVGSNPVTCNPLDQCHNAGTCNTTNGICSNPNKTDGTGCNDSNACTQTDTCVSGSCVGGNPVTCNPLDQCHNAGTCNTANGVCSNPNKTDGTGCSDGNACTTGDKCVTGSCVSGSATPTDDGNICTTDSCDPTTGVHHVAAPSGTQCSAPSCTAGTATPAGICSGTTCPTVTPVSCNGNVCSGTACSGGCNGDDTKCISGDYCSAANACTPKVGNGTSCTASNQCTSGICVDGVCCGTACGGGDPNDCQACNVAGSLGTCIVPVGKTCRASTGVCDAAETCQTGVTTCPADAAAPATTVCRPSTDGNVCDVAETCGGSFTCPADTATRNGQACTDDGNACSVDVCSGNACTHSTPANALTVCRASAGPCDSQETCDGSTTVCPANAFFDGSHVCRPVATGTLCDVAETCTLGTAACPNDGFAGAGTSCRTATCSAGVLTQAASCPGSSSACPTATTQNCSPYLCASATACATTCAVKTDCANGDYCNAAHQCVPVLSPGGVCSAAEQCGTGICVDGRCCNNQCNGQCQACDVAGLEGTCSPIKDKVPHGARTACAGDGSACQGFCDGTNTASCALPGSTTQCLAPSCTNGVATPVEVCNGTGNCPTQAPVACAPGICEAATGPKAICVGGGGTPCTADVECSSGHYCVAGQCKAQNPDGTACGADDQCVNGHCVDGLCCNTSCDGQCEACDVTTAKGTCTPVTDKPHGARPACVSDPQYPSCAGVCDGKNANACTFPGQGTSCRDASCTKGLAVLPASCTGTGTCSPEQDQTCPGDCNASGKLCDNGCTTDGDCPMNQYCSGGVCVATLGPGAACSTSSQCVGACVDGFCCNTACDHQCEACNVTGHEGVCTAVTGAPVGLRQACATDGTAACVGKCDGTNRTTCAYPSSTVQCSAGACADGVATLTAFCDGAGSCPTGQNQICAPADCSGTLCGGDCASGQACGAGNFCSAGVCRPTLPQGTACASDAQCAGGNCVDGYCCNVACDGQCQACDVAGAEGTCTTLTNDLPHGGRAACQGLGACAALCDGSSSSACTYAGPAVKCGKASCAQNGEAIPAPECNGAGVCLAGPAVNCGAYTCDDASGTCQTTCVLQSDCSPGFECVATKCVQSSSDGGVVVDAGTGGSAAMPDASMTGAGASGKGGSAGAPTTDASTTDSGMSMAGENDGGLVPPGHSTDKGSCGCNVPGSESRGTSALWLAGLALIGVATRRRRSAKRGRDAHG